MTFLVWLIGMFLLYKITGWMWNGKGAEGAIAALLVFGGWTLLVTLYSIYEVVRKFLMKY